MTRLDLRFACFSILHSLLAASFMVGAWMAAVRGNATGAFLALGGGTAWIVLALISISLIGRDRK